MRVQAALVREQGVNFNVVVVKSHVLDTPSTRESLRSRMSRAFYGTPTVLMAQNSAGTPTYHGRDDLVRWLANQYFGALPWKEYTLT